MVTQSSITSLLITGIFWMVLWTSQSTEFWLNRFVINNSVKIESFEESLIEQKSQLDNLKSKSPDDFRIDKRQERIDEMEQEVELAKETLDELMFWYKPVSQTLVFLPKTRQTTQLLERWLSDDSGFDIQAMLRGEMQSVQEIEEFDATTWGARRRETGRRLQEDYSSRSLWYVVGTSLLFEGFILGLSAWFFCRRDF